MRERWTWREIKVNLGVQLKTLGCYMINGWGRHPLGDSRCQAKYFAVPTDVYACACCGNYVQKECIHAQTR